MRGAGGVMGGVLKLLRSLLFVAWTLPLLAAPLAHANAPKVYGLELLPWSKQLEDDRYMSSRDWEKTLKHFKDKLRGSHGVRWHREVNLPTVKYVHIENTNEKAEWEGINIYQLPNSQVRMYVLKRQPKLELATTPSKP
jgi:hypothetical protein